MKNKLQLGLVLGMIFLFTNALGQTNGGAAEKVENNRAPECHLSLLLDATKANLNFGKLNSASPGYKKNHSGCSDFDAILNWCYTKICRLVQIIFHYKGMGVERK